MAITDQEEARRYFEACVDHAMRLGSDRETAERIERSNLGYYAGYCDRETAERVVRLFDCAYPIFGRAYPSPDEAFAAGQRVAARRQEEKG